MSKEHIFYESILTKSQVDAIFSALKSIDAFYVPKAPPLAERTKLPADRLFEKLKEPRKEKVGLNELFSDLDVEKLDSMFVKQLENEMRGIKFCVVVES